MMEGEDTEMYNGHSVSVVMPAYNEQQGVYDIVKDFKALDVVDEVLVIDNNSVDKTVQLAQEGGAIVKIETRQGFGYACQTGLKSAQGEFIILVEPDGTFLARDIFKFLAYVEDFSLIQGTRVTKEMIWRGANMGHLLKWGNWFVAKILECLYRGPSLSDMGCTYRLIKKESLEKIKDSLTTGNSAFLCDMTVSALKNKIKIIEIPVNYLPRKGVSKITGSKWRTVIVCLQMFFIIVIKLFKK